MDSANKKSRTPGKDATPKPSDSHNHNVTDPLIGWFNLAKPSRDRQPKRSWKRGNQRGRIDAYLAAQLALLIVFVALTVGGVKS